MRHAALCCALLMALAPPVALAEETTLDGAAFDALTRGTTLDWAREGRFYGRETYGENRRVWWQSADGSCEIGVWESDAEGHICFHYEGQPSAPCWRFGVESGTLYAQPLGEGPEARLRQSGPPHTRRVTCQPEVGA